MFDLVIENGLMLNPGHGEPTPRDIGIVGTEIRSIEPDLRLEPAKKRIDVENALVLPGLIDIHTHVYPGVTSMGIDPVEISFPTGVTTTIDGGSCGSATFDGFRALAESSPVRVRCFLNLSAIGLSGAKRVGELVDGRFADPDGVSEILTAHPDVAIGIKVRASRDAVGDASVPYLAMAREIADETDRRLLVHIGNSPEPIESILDQLRGGDIVTHFQTPKSEGLVDEDGCVKAVAVDARRRGVLFDCGHGMTHFDFTVAEHLLGQGFIPDLISSDVSATSIPDLHPGLITVVNKWLAIGLDLEAALAACTTRACEEFFPGSDFGFLGEGRRADIAILAVEEGSFTYSDAAGATRSSTTRLVPTMTIRDGGVVMVAEGVFAS